MNRTLNGLYTTREAASFLRECYGIDLTENALRAAHARDDLDASVTATGRRFFDEAQLDAFAARRGVTKRLAYGTVVRVLTKPGRPVEQEPPVADAIGWVVGHTPKGIVKVTFPGHERTALPYPPEELEEMKPCESPIDGAKS